jgi:hypothetical protein
LAFHWEDWEFWDQFLAPSPAAQHRLSAGMVLNLSFGRTQGDLLELLVLAVATQGLNLCPFQELHAKGHAGFFKGAH